MNSIVIVGRAVRDAEVRYSTGEKSTAFGNYTLAVDRPYKKDGEKETDFIMCKVVGKTAEFAESKNANQQNNNVQAGPSPFGNMPTDSEGFMNIPDGIDEELPFN